MHVTQSPLSPLEQTAVPDLVLMERGLSLIEDTRPIVSTRVARRYKLALQTALLDAMPGWRAPAPFTVYWRVFLSWSPTAHVGCGLVEWPRGVHAFAAGGGSCTLRSPTWVPQTVLLLHLGRWWTEPQQA